MNRQELDYRLMEAKINFDNASADTYSVPKDIFMNIFGPEIYFYFGPLNIVATPRDDNKPYISWRKRRWLSDEDEDTHEVYSID